MNDYQRFDSATGRSCYNLGRCRSCVAVECDCMGCRVIRNHEPNFVLHDVFGPAVITWGDIGFCPKIQEPTHFDVHGKPVAGAAVIWQVCGPNISRVGGGAALDSSRGDSSSLPKGQPAPASLEKKGDINLRFIDYKLQDASQRDSDLTYLAEQVEKLRRETYRESAIQASILLSEHELPIVGAQLEFNLFRDRQILSKFNVSDDLRVAEIIVTYKYPDLSGPVVDSRYRVSFYGPYLQHTETRKVTGSGDYYFGFSLQPSKDFRIMEQTGGKKRSKVVLDYSTVWKRAGWFASCNFVFGMKLFGGTNGRLPTQKDLGELSVTFVVHTRQNVS